MKVAVFSTKPYDRKFFDEANAAMGHELLYFDARLTGTTAPLASGCEAVCAFVNDDLGAPVLETLKQGGLKWVALRCAGFNHVDLEAADRLGLAVVRVPAYSPHAVAEHTVALILGLNRKIYRAHNRVREGNFALHGLLGFDLYGKTVGIVGTGQIGVCVARIMQGFGCKVLAFDVQPSPEALALGVEYCPLDELLSEADILTLHCPLNSSTRKLIDAQAVARMKRGAMLVNTGRGGLVDTSAAIDGLKSGQIGYLGLDVYEEEANLFFEDRSGKVMQDDTFARLLTFPNVLITGHQAFFTREALEGIAATTLGNLAALQRDGTCDNLVRFRPA